MYTLGINAVFHDSAACLIKDGNMIAAAEDERFTHIKHGKRPIPFSTYELPYHAIDYCLQEANIHLSEVDHIAYSFDPYILLGDDHKGGKNITLPLEPSAHPKDDRWTSVWDPLFLSHIVNAPRQLIGGYPHHLQQRFKDTKLDDFQWHFVEHHLCHAASAFFPSPYKSAAVFTIDGRGEKATTTFNVGKENALTRIGQVYMPNSLGLLYEKLTTYLGFLHSSDEYKVMALASYGKPAFVNDFESIIHWNGQGKYTIDDIDFESLFGPARQRNEELSPRHFDIAHSLQKVLEDTVLNMLDWLYKEAKLDNLCMAGGVALNCVMNAKIRDRGPFKNVWVQPAAGDSGTALGAALEIDLKERKNGKRNYTMNNVYLGPEYSDEEIENYLKWAKAPYKKLNNIAEETAELLAEDKIIGWFQGKMEFGPRALGNRSILASPIHEEMQAKLNEIKDREDFRPVAPVVLEEKANKWFEGTANSPFMLFITNIKQGKKDKIPAVCHTDGTARIQTVNREQNEIYYNLLKAFYKKTGVPVLTNTSFNTRGEPIVCSPQDAVSCFWTSPLDALVIGSFLLEK